MYETEGEKSCKTAGSACLHSLVACLAQYMSEDRCGHFLVHVNLRRPLSSAAGDTGAAEEVTGRSQPRSVINTPYYPSFNAPSG